MVTSIDSNDDIIDSRDVIERISDLRIDMRLDERQELNELLAIPLAERTQEDEDAIHDLQEALAGFDEDENDREEYEMLLDLQGQCEGYTDWHHGVQLIRESHMKEYAQQLAEEIGAIGPDAGWPAYCIDWEQATNDLLMDYASVEFDGVTYYVR